MAAQHSAICQVSVNSVTTRHYGNGMRYPSAVAVHDSMFVLLL